MFIDYENEHKCNSEENSISFEPCNSSSGIIFIKDFENDIIVKYNNKDVPKYQNEIPDKITKNIEKLKIENYIKIIGYIETDVSSISCVYLPIKQSVLIVFYIKKTDSCKYKVVKF